MPRSRRSSLYGPPVSSANSGNDRPPGAVHCITRYRLARANLRTQAHRINHCLGQSALLTPKMPIPQSGRTESGTVDARNGTHDPDLAFIQDRWPDLPDWVKADILTTVKRYAKTPDPDARRTAVQDALRKAHAPGGAI